MDEFYLFAIGISLFLLACLLLGTMAAVVGALERIRALEDAPKDNQPLKTLIAESVEKQARLIEKSEEVEETNENDKR